jgi:hypothetical protein
MASSISIVSGQPVDTLTDRSSTITTGGSAQTLMAANPQRSFFYIQNDSAGDLRVNPFAAASATAGIRLEPGALLRWDVKTPTGAISVFGATTGQRFQAGEG